MSNITIEAEGARLYILGNTFPIKNVIKEAGGHWDADRKAWWVGKAKRAIIEAAISTPSAPEGKESDVSADTQVKGKVSYKGKTYFMVAETRDGQSYKLCTLDGSLVFWAKKEKGAQLVKSYGHERGFRGYGSRSRQNEIEYPTLGSLRRFVEDRRSETPDQKEQRDYDRGWRSSGCAECRRLGDYCPRCAFDEFDN